MDRAKLESVAHALVQKGKGILAADESSGTIKKRFDSIRLKPTEQNRLFYRRMLFTTPGMEAFISGVILFDETIRQIGPDGVLLGEILAGKGVLPGIKVDKGAKDMAGFPGEKITEGLDGLRERLAEYRDLGARFAKWRSVITIGEAIPTRSCIDANARGLARYAALCQEVGLVPIVEPEVLMDGVPFHRPLRRGLRRHPHQRLFRASPASRAPGRHPAQAQHGNFRQTVSPAGRGRGDCRSHPSLFPAECPGRRARHRLPVGRPDTAPSH